MFKNKGQSIIEYTALALLVVVSTMVVGPYVLRAVGAHFKIWQEEVDDSSNDRMLQKEIVLPFVCTLGPSIPGACNARIGTATNPPKPCATGSLSAENLRQRADGNYYCSKEERKYHQEGPKSNPTCGNCKECRFDTSCCTEYRRWSESGYTYDNPECGRKELNVNPLTGEALYRAPDRDLQGQTPAPNELENQSCFYGEELLRNNCYPTWATVQPIGSNVPPIVCRRNANCDPRCTNTKIYNPATTMLCGGYEPYLTKDTPLSFYYRKLSRSIVKILMAKNITNRNNGQLLALFCGCGKKGLPDGAGVVTPADFVDVRPIVNVNTLFTDLQNRNYIDATGTILPRFYDLANVTPFLRNTDPLFPLFNTSYVGPQRTDIFNVLKVAPTAPGVPANKFCHMTKTIKTPPLDCEMNSDITLASWSYNNDPDGIIAPPNGTDNQYIPQLLLDTPPIKIRKVNAIRKASKWKNGPVPPSEVYTDALNLGIGVENDRDAKLADPAGEWQSWKYHKYHYWAKKTVSQGALVTSCPNYSNPAVALLETNKCLLKCKPGYGLVVGNICKRTPITCPLVERGGLTFEYDWETKKVCCPPGKVRVQTICNGTGDECEWVSSDNYCATLRCKRDGNGDDCDDDDCQHDADNIHLLCVTGGTSHPPKSGNGGDHACSWDDDSPYSNSLCNADAAICGGYVMPSWCKEFD